MKIKQVLSRNKNMFSVLTECEFCKFQEVRAGAELEAWEKAVLFRTICLRCSRSTKDHQTTSATKPLNGTRVKGL